MTVAAPPSASHAGLDAALLHPMNSSRLMLSLLRLVDAGRKRLSGGGDVGGLVSLPVLRRLLSALHYRDAATMLHARRTSLISVGIAQRLGWEKQSLSIIELSSLMHDLGKIGTPDSILLKPGRLCPDEAEFITVQQRVAISLLQACGIQHEVIEIIGESHGLDGGQGNLRGELSLGARILAVADAFDSLTTRQSYRQAFGQKQALEVLTEQAGKQFDRNVVAALGRWLETPEARSLQDHESAAAAIQANAPVSRETMDEASELCHLFSALHSMESMYEAYFVVDRERRICIWNRGAERLFGRPARDAVGYEWSLERLPNLRMPPVLESCFLDDVMQSQQAACREMTVNGNDGNARETEVHIVPLIDHGQPQGALAMVYDMQQSRKNEGQFRQLQMAATRDPLTGALNRGELEERMRDLFDECGQAGAASALSVIFFDLDHFKAINDRLGHSVGDRVLIDVARLVQDETYSGETLARYGGEEFVVVCPQTDLKGAMERAERLRRILTSTNIADRNDLRVTASFGVAQLEPGDDVAELLHRADQALYDAKRSGRNRTCERRRETVAVAPEKPKKRSPWIVEQYMVTHVASDLLVYKLKGFIEEHESRLIKSSAEQIVVHSGSAGLFGWGSNPNRQPVKVVIDISDAPASEASRNRRILLHAVVEPLSRPSKPEAFHQRAHQVLDYLRSYCIAEICSAEGKPTHLV
ncbi:MAG: diguanylate cyclase [Planctomycetaceae bacterium]|nr:diguanylate cyclase [Planctomycetaceae bacterium]